MRARVLNHQLKGTLDVMIARGVMELAPSITSCHVF